jgi:hypothetical protein
MDRSQAEKPSAAVGRPPRGTAFVAASDNAPSEGEARPTVSRLDSPQPSESGCGTHEASRTERLMILSFKLWLCAVLLELFWCIAWLAGLVG